MGEQKGCNTTQLLWGIMNEWNQSASKRTAVCVRLALNTTPAIVVPVFRGFGTWRLSKWPSKAEFLWGHTMKDRQRERETGILLGHIVNIFARIPTRKKQKTKNKTRISYFHFWSQSNTLSQTDVRITHLIGEDIGWSTSSYLAVLSKLKPAAGVWWTFDSAILEPSAPVRCVVGARGRRWLRLPAFDFAVGGEEKKNGESQLLFCRQWCQHRGESMSFQRLLCPNKCKIDWRTFIVIRYDRCFTRSETMWCVRVATGTRLCEVVDSNLCWLAASHLNSDQVKFAWESLSFHVCTPRGVWL